MAIKNFCIVLGVNTDLSDLTEEQVYDHVCEMLWPKHSGDPSPIVVITPAVWLGTVDTGRE